tara:strand:- start:173849 stop:174361 length:513 start_codon:yes stop_codon:yes gene_type:complete
MPKLAIELRTLKGLTPKGSDDKLGDSGEISNATIMSAATLYFKHMHDVIQVMEFDDQESRLDSFITDLIFNDANSEGFIIRDEVQRITTEHVLTNNYNDTKDHLDFSIGELSEKERTAQLEKRIMSFQTKLCYFLIKLAKFIMEQDLYLNYKHHEFKGNILIVHMTDGEF